jgi:ribosomal protein L30/L7E
MVSLQGVKRRVRYGGALVRVKPEVEELVIEVSEGLGCSRDKVRNTAILLGLILIRSGFEVPDDNKEIVKLLKIVKTFIKSVDELGGEGMKHK